LSQMLAQSIGSAPAFEFQLIVYGQIKWGCGLGHNGNLCLLIDEFPL